MAREHYFDFIRGLAIIMVVAIHCYPSHIRFSDGWMEICEIVLRNLMNCAVPLFLAISGYFIGRRVCANPDFSWKSFWSRQVPKVYVPCMVFSIPWLMLDLYSGVSPLKGIVMTLL